uniref:Uncharacterized protein n=1 Tax=Rhizophora mucronata TaxID=61149 RepID=A0A2P2Q8F1_RHIMU
MPNSENIMMDYRARKLESMSATEMASLDITKA